MALQPVLARTTLVQIRASDGTTWIELEGKQNVAIDPSNGAVVQEKTHYGNADYAAGMKTQIGSGMEISYVKLRVDITGARAPGQARVEELDQALGAAGFGAVRVREEADTFWQVWSETMIQAGSSTGGTND